MSAATDDRPSSAAKGGAALDLAARERGFDTLYRSDPDPWGFETSDYERAKYDATLAALAGRRFGHALEVGCSIGVLTERLAAVAERVTGLDVSSVALERARARARVPTARFLHAEVPRDWPTGPYDLVVVSEVLYFLRADEIEALARLVRRDLVSGGACVCVNWLGECDMPVDGARAAEIFRAALRWPVRTQATPLYRIDVFTAP